MADPTSQITRAGDPAATSSSHQYMRDRLRTLRAVYGGTQTLLAAGEEHLPRYSRETDPKYQVRRKKARLRRNMFRQSVDRITGRIFEVPVRLNEPTPTGEVIADDADLRGSSLDRCGRTLYKEALKLGLYHVLVDYPVVDARNLAEERAARARPYLVMLDPEQVLRCYEDTKGQVIHLAWMEVSTEYDEALFREVTVKRVHERFLGRARTWVDRPPRPPQAVNGANPSSPTAGWQREGEDRVVRIPSGDAPGRIMFHTLYAEKEDHMVGRTPLTEVADLTIEHFQLASLFRLSLDHNLFPVLTATGIETKDVGDIIMGPDTVLGSTKSDAEFKMLEHNGIALKAGADDLLALEQRAEAYAGQLTKPSGDVKATTAAINSAEVSSFAKDMAMSLQDVLQAICDDCALWTSEASIGRVEVNMDFAVDLPDGDLAELGGARRAGDLSRPTYWKELARRNILSRDFDPDEETLLLEEQEAEAMAREQEAMKFAAGLEAPREPGGAGGPPAE